MQVRNSLILLLMLVLLRCGADFKSDISTYKVKYDDFLISETETGELKATNSTMLSAPAINWRFGDLKITQIAEDGTEVQKGDTLIRFDEAEVQKAIIDAQAELDIAKAELEKIRADQQSKLEDLEADLRMAEISFEISKLELEQAQYKADIDKKKIQLQLNQAEISLAKAREEIQNQKKIHQEEFHKQELKIQQLQNNLQDARETLAKMTVTAPTPGLTIIERSWASGNKWQVGEQPWPGVPIISLPDLTEIKAVTEINEVDISKIRLDQKAHIKLDAYPDTTFTGKVIDIAVLAQKKDNKSNVKVFPVEILIEGQHKLLMPGMTVRCEIIVDKLDSVLFVPLDGLFKKKGEPLVYVKQDGSFKERKVIVGVDNNDFVVIKEGLQTGEEVALMDPTELTETSMAASKKKGEE